MAVARGLVAEGARVVLGATSELVHDRAAEQAHPQARRDRIARGADLFTVDRDASPEALEEKFRFGDELELTS
jgi:hypothetical protein